MEAELPEGKIHHQRMPADDVTRDYMKVLFIEHESGECAWCDAIRWRLARECVWCSTCCPPMGDHEAQLGPLGGKVEPFHE